MEPEISCPLCSNEFKSDGVRVPVQLSCAHNICSECSHSASPASGIVCPLCSIVSDGPLTKNYEYMRLLVGQENVAKSKLENSLVICDRCHVSTASIECRVCEMATCKSCDHILHDVDSSHERNAISETEQDICETHIEPLTQYCSKCKVAVCAVCMSTTHSRHKTRDLHTAAEDLRSQLSNLTAETAPLVSKGESIARYIDQYSSSTKDAQGNYTVKQAAKTAINNQFERLLEALHARRKELLQQVDTALDNKAALLSRQQALALDIVAKQKAAALACEGLIARGDGAVCRDYTATRSRLKAAIAMDTADLIGPICDLRVPVSFEPELRAVLGVAQQLGRVDGIGPSSQGITLGSLIEALNATRDAPTAIAAAGKLPTASAIHEAVAAGSTTNSDVVGKESAATIAQSKKGSAGATTAGKRGTSFSSSDIGSTSHGRSTMVTTVKEDVHDEREHLGRILQTDLRYPDLYVGLKLDVLDTANRWAEAEVMVKYIFRLLPLTMCI
jgi:uncharacterized protein YqgV (UPF0045/DUF77 family)